MSTAPHPRTGRYTDLLQGYGALILLRLAVLSPLLALLAGVTPVTVLIACLCPLLYIFVILPLRFSAAEGLMAAAYGNYPFATGRIISLSGYTGKLKAVGSQAWRVALFAIPLAVMGGYALYVWKSFDALTILRMLNTLGRSVFAAGGFIQGILIVALVALVGLIILLFGLLPQSTYRYEYAMVHDGAKARANMKAHASRIHVRKLLVGLMNAAMAAPAFAAVVYILYLWLGNAIGMTLPGAFTVSGDPAFWAPIAILVSIALLYWPLLPIRRRLAVSLMRPFLTLVAQPVDESKPAAEA